MNLVIILFEQKNNIFDHLLLHYILDELNFED